MRPRQLYVCQSILAFYRAVVGVGEMDRGCVRSISRSTLEKLGASGEFQPLSLAKRLRLVFDTAALPGQCPDAPRKARGPAAALRLASIAPMLGSTS